MNILFLSPGFPPNAYLFCSALSGRGATVVGIGDLQSDRRSEVERAMSELIIEPRMADYDVLSRVVTHVYERHGRIDRIDSCGERWLETEARLRGDFGVPGLRSEDLVRMQSKLGMAAFFANAAITYPRTVPLAWTSEVRRLMHDTGFPLVCKPDQGSGATDTFVLRCQEDLEHALGRNLPRHIVQPFIVGDIVTFDGLVDREGDIVFCTSHVYDSGIMQVREGRLDGHYYSLRVIPPALEVIGRRAVSAFGIRERFFHLEFFACPDGRYVGLEMNLRPPGGFTTDMMNYACDFDVYDLWAAVLLGDVPAAFSYDRKFHTAHAGRRKDREYRLGHDELVRELGTTLVLSRPIPAAFADTMGDEMYLLRHAELQSLQDAIALVQDVP